MIYLVITDIQNKKDCHFKWQSDKLFDEKVKNYIDNSKSKKTKLERLAAYTTLLCSLKKFFSIEQIEIEKNKNGKPYLDKENVFFSISHSDNLAVIALSDEGEIGVDAQSFVDENKANRLEKRFLSDIKIKNNQVEMKIFYFDFSGDKPIFIEKNLDIDRDDDFLSKWVYSESVIKYWGTNFSDILKINSLSENTKTQIISYQNNKIAITISK